VGFDREKDSLRTFRLDRIVSEVSVSKKVNSFEIPEVLPDHNGDECKDFAILRVRKHRGHQLRSLSRQVEPGDDWDEITLSIVDESWLLRAILWHRDDVIVLKPPALRERVINSLKELRVLHG
jgi:proteasome accessory factor B